MDYKAEIHTTDWKCPDCNGMQFLRKEKDKDSYGNTILVIECSCGTKYWFHNRSGIKGKITFKQFIDVCNRARAVIGSKITPLNERYNLVMEMLFSYFNTDFTDDNLQMGASQVLELQHRIAYDIELVQELWK